jgi:hypothetical protein
MSDKKIGLPLKILAGALFVLAAVGLWAVANIAERKLSTGYFFGPPSAVENLQK